jgi:hypothetical protein
MFTEVSDWTKSITIFPLKVLVFNGGQYRSLLSAWEKFNNLNIG